ncbi:hypothetical protein [Cupriavidus necator]|uniref:hypothetical protein n=1 Tax=Cupriavidus necator TaxID=106590 RepID=UPI0005B33976|nr:hypothetical protein [Cupriavidus necator]
MLNIPQVKSSIIENDEIFADPDYQGLKIVRAQTDKDANKAYYDNKYEFQHQHGDYTVVRATLCRKGYVATEVAEKQRITVMIHPSLKLFTEIVKYDPAEPPKENYYALEMLEAHKLTQSDFKGQKAANKEMFKTYILEGISGVRPIFLPIISGWQSKAVFSKTVFVAFDEEDPNAMYGTLYLPKSPVMQSDGQTQTAALFAVANTADAIEKSALDRLSLTLEIELNVDARKAGQSFADRNGRGSKKNRNLVIGLNTAEPISDLRLRATKDTVFENRIADGRTTGTSETATTNIVDLSTMEQMLLGALTNNRFKPEQLKHYHVEPLLPFAREFTELLDEVFASQWPATTPPKQDTFRRLYVHGWPFALKAIAFAYFESRADKLTPILAAMTVKNALKSQEVVFAEALAAAENPEKEPVISFEELKKRLLAIDWLRYRRHWINITNSNVDKSGNRKTFVLKSTGERKVVGLAPNTAANIATVKNKIISDKWIELTGSDDAPIAVKK